jgi:hypothetical protein
VIVTVAETVVEVVIAEAVATVIAVVTAGKAVAREETTVQSAHNVRLKQKANNRNSQRHRKAPPFLVREAMMLI